METSNIQNNSNSPDVQIMNSPTTLVFKGEEVIVDNDHYINSKKCEFDGNTSNLSLNEDAFCQSSCDDIIYNEENIEINKNDEKPPKINTIDNYNTAEPNDNKMENFSCITEPQLNSDSSIVEHNDYNVENTMENTLNNKKDDTTLVKKKSKKSSKIPKHKKSYVKMYLKFKEKLNKKSKSNKKSMKKESPIRDVSTIPVNTPHENEKYHDNDMEITPMNGAFNQISEPEPDIQASTSNNISKPADTNNYSEIVDVTPINDMDVREITVITANGETILLPTKRRTDSLPRNLDSRKLSIQSDSTITPQKLSSLRYESVNSIEGNSVLLENEEQKSEPLSIDQNEIVSDKNIENNNVASEENIDNGGAFYDLENSRIVITTVKEEVVPDDDGKDKVIITKIEEQVVIEPEDNEEKDNEDKVVNEPEGVNENDNDPVVNEPEDENRTRNVDLVCPVKMKDESYADLSDNDKRIGETTLDPSNHENNHSDMIGAGVSMVKPFHLDNEPSTQFIEETTKNIDLPLINENVNSTTSQNGLLTVPTQNEVKPKDKIPLVKLSSKYQFSFILTLIFINIDINRYKYIVINYIIIMLYICYINVFLFYY